jgi:UDP-2-acetamido-3-amino-2,3-dideoxy-glucuronate N-acetyltransferase
MNPINFIDETAIIGEHTAVWHFAVIQEGVKIGHNCSIGSGCEVGKGAIVGNHSRVSAHVFLPANSVIEERVFIGPGCVFTDDRHPRAGNNQSYVAQPPYVESGASIGAGSVILPGVRIGAGAMIGAGAVVTRDVAPHEHVRGEPARIRPYSKLPGETLRLVAVNAAPWPGVRGS